MLRQRDGTVKPGRLRILIDARWTQQQEFAIRRDAEVIAVLGLQAVPDCVDARLHRLPTNLLEGSSDTGHAYERAVLDVVPAVTVRRQLQTSDPPELECGLAGDHLEARFLQLTPNGRGELCRRRSGLRRRGEGLCVRNRRKKGESDQRTQGAFCLLPCAFRVQ